MALPPILNHIYHHNYLATYVTNMLVVLLADVGCPSQPTQYQSLGYNNVVSDLRHAPNTPPVSLVPPPHLVFLLLHRLFAFEYG